MSLRFDEIRQFAFSQGFCDIGAVPYQVTDDANKHYLNWIEKKYNAGMDYLERNLDKRSDVRKILEGAESIIVLAFNYHTKFKHNDYDILGKISRYAWGDDYHDVIKSKLRSVANFIESKSNAKTWIYVDTGPVMEKIWAELAGIGWQGKNSLIISRKNGSYIFLSVILTTYQLNEYSVKHKEFCGTCRRCIVFCPTNAIIEPKVVDANKCISYWTIEAKSSLKIPEEISEKQSGWIFGCDICQDVCPWNKSLKIYQNEHVFHPRAGETSLNVNKILNLSEEDFRIRFKNSPIKRAKLSGLQRSAESLINSVQKPK